MKINVNKLKSRDKFKMRIEVKIIAITARPVGPRARPWQADAEVCDQPHNSQLE